MKHLLYHPTIASTGQVFEGDEQELLDNMPGWYDSQHKFPMQPVDNLYPIAEKLLRGEGLNHSSYTRAKLGKKSITQTDRNKTRKEYEEILKHYEGKITKQNKDWFI